MQPAFSRGDTNEIMVFFVAKCYYTLGTKKIPPKNPNILPSNFGGELVSSGGDGENSFFVIAAQEFYASSLLHGLAVLSGVCPVCGWSCNVRFLYTFEMPMASLGSKVEFNFGRPFAIQVQLSSVPAVTCDSLIFLNPPTSAVSHWAD